MLAGYQPGCQRVGLGGAGVPVKTVERQDALSLLLFYGNASLCLNRIIPYHIEFKWNFISQLQTVQSCLSNVRVLQSHKEVNLTENQAVI